MPRDHDAGRQARQVDPGAGDHARRARRGVLTGEEDVSAGLGKVPGGRDEDPAGPREGPGGRARGPTRSGTGPVGNDENPGWFFDASRRSPKRSGRCLETPRRCREGNRRAPRVPRWATRRSRWPRTAAPPGSAEIPPGAARAPVGSMLSPPGAFAIPVDVARGPVGWGSDPGGDRAGTGGIARDPRGEQHRPHRGARARPGGDVKIRVATDSDPTGVETEPGGVRKAPTGPKTSPAEAARPGTGDRLASTGDHAAPPRDRAAPPRDRAAPPAPGRSPAASKRSAAKPDPAPPELDRSPARSSRAPPGTRPDPVESVTPPVGTRATPGGARPRPPRAPPASPGASPIPAETRRRLPGALAPPGGVGALSGGERRRRPSSSPDPHEPEAEPGGVQLEGAAEGAVRGQAGTNVVALDRRRGTPARGPAAPWYDPPSDDHGEGVPEGPADDWARRRPGCRCVLEAAEERVGRRPHRPPALDRGLARAGARREALHVEGRGLHPDGARHRAVRRPRPRDRRPFLAANPRTVVVRPRGVRIVGARPDGRPRGSSALAAVSTSSAAPRGRSCCGSGTRGPRCGFRSPAASGGSLAEDLFFDLVARIADLDLEVTMPGSARAGGTCTAPTSRRSISWRARSAQERRQRTFGAASSGCPHEEPRRRLAALRDEIEGRAYLALVAAVEATVQLDVRARMRGRASVPLQEAARRWRREERQGRRIVVEDVLDAWAALPGARRAPISEFKQLLPHRHWLAHGRYFPDRHGGVAGRAAGLALARSRALFAELRRLDPAFPR